MYIKNLLINKYNLVSILGALLLFLFWFAIASAATLTIDANDQTLATGETATLNILVNTEGVAINNVEAKISFPTDIIEVLSIVKNGSILPLWVEDPSFSNSAGIVTFNGGVPTPGYIGTRGVVLSLVVKAKKSGDAEFVFSNTAVRANDGLGTNVLSSQRGVVLNITKKQDSVSETIVPISSVGTSLDVKSLTHPDETKWYANNEPEFSWQLPEDALEVRTLIGSSPSGVPAVSYIPPISKKKVGELPDGTYYFSVRVRTPSGWGPVSRYKLNIDTVPPKPFSITFPHGNTSWEPQPVVFFNTTDKQSGVDYYDIKIGEGTKPIKTAPLADSNPYVIPPQLPGNYTLTVTAVDRAGNTRISSEEFTIEAIDAPTITYYPEEIEEGDILKVRGTTYSNSDIYAYIHRGDELVSEEYTRSNDIGDFLVIVAKELGSGVYTLTTRVVDDRGAQSVESPPITISVKSGFVVGLTNSLLKYVSIAVLVLALVGLLIWIAYYIRFKLMRTVNRMRHESNEAEKVSKEIFSILRDEIANHKERLKKDKSVSISRELQFLEVLEDQLRQSEEIIKKEVNDISKP